jgi:hypothetical protein
MAVQQMAASSEEQSPVDAVEDDLLEEVLDA